MKKTRPRAKISIFVTITALLLVLSGCNCDHQFGNWMVETPATCTAEGTQIRICAECNEPEKGSIPIIDHAYGDWAVIKEATCVEEGVQARTCSGCGAEEETAIPTIDHAYGDSTVTKEATCVEEGVQTKVCSGCGAAEETAIPTTEHTYGEWSVTKKATCTEEGVQSSACSVCGATEEEVIPLADHSYGNWVTTKGATCTEAGVKTKTCSSCGKTETQTIEAGHKWKDATCTAPKTCSVCGKTEGSVANHKWKDATCTAPKTCSSCGKTEGSALGHNTGSNGKCTRCGTKISIDMRTKISAPTEKYAILRGKNSVGLVELDWTADNISGKTIKYYTVTVYYYNSVGDRAKNDITRETSYTVKYVGPVEPGGMLLVGDVGYCSICREVVIGEITLEYTDGTVDTGWYGYSFKIP